MGAGASVGALPLVNAMTINEKSIRGIPGSFYDLAQELRNYNAIPSNREYQNFLIQQLEEIRLKAIEFGTIDTYAKYLYLLDKDKLKSLKDVLIFFLLTEQIIKKHFDRRSLIFLTTVLQNSVVFPTNVNILSWNYDYQIETAASYFVKEEFRFKTGAYTHKPPLIEHWPSFGKSTNVNTQLIHLNGCAGYYKIERDFAQHFLDEEVHFDKLLPWMQKAPLHEYLNFAWEKSEINKIALRKACEIANKTDVLVIIGYSFPVFNREIDKKIFENLYNKPDLKIYYQDPISDGQFLKEQFDLHNDINIVPISKVENYHIPIEL